MFQENHSRKIGEKASAFAKAVEPSAFSKGVGNALAHPVTHMIGSVAVALAGAALVGYCGGQLVSSLRPVSEKVLQKIT